MRSLPLRRPRRRSPKKRRSDGAPAAIDDGNTDGLLFQPTVGGMSDEAGFWWPPLRLYAR